LQLKSAQGFHGFFQPRGIFDGIAIHSRAERFPDESGQCRAGTDFDKRICAEPRQFANRILHPHGREDLTLQKRRNGFVPLFFAEAVEKAATILGVKVVVAIRDEGANLVLLHAMDDSYIASVQASQDKAYTAVALKMPTHIALDESRGGSLDGLTNGNGILLLGGGYPLRTDKKIYGGIGVSGGTKEQDTTLAMVADAYFKARFA